VLTPAAGLIMDMVLTGLLLAALWFGMRLNARLKSLRGGQDAFIRAVAELDQAAIKAHSSLRELHANADESQELLHGRILAARDLLSRLETQIDRAERARRELEAEAAPVFMRAAPPEPAPRTAPSAAPEAASEPAPLTLRTRAQMRDNWSAARGSEARQTYAGRGRPAYEADDEDAMDEDDLPPPAPRRSHDLNDRLDGSARQRPEAHPQTDEAEVSALGLQAINEMLMALAAPKAGPEAVPGRGGRAPAPERERDFRASAETGVAARVSETRSRPQAPSEARPGMRTRLPSALDAELFDGVEPLPVSASARPAMSSFAPSEPAPSEPAPSRPLFRRLR